MQQPPQPTLRCAKLSAFAADDWAVVERAFATAQPCQLYQAWLPAPEPEFAPATVRVGWTAGSLCVYAVLDDRDIFNPVTEFNAPAFQQGDAFEIFLRPTTQEAYYEFHVGPANQRFQLRVPAKGAVCRQPMAEMLFDRRVIKSQVKILAEQWLVLAVIPLDLVQESGVVGAGTHWRFSFCRYDYTRGRKSPVLSSTSPHQQLDFHRLQEWGELVFR